VRGDNQTFQITPDPGYEIKNVKVDRRDQGPISTYTFFNVSDNHKIEASFTRLTFTIIASAGPGGKIDPSGEVVVNGGDDRTFKISADGGYQIADVRVDGISQGPVSEYKFNDVVENHVIEASFIRSIAIREVSIPDQPMKIGDEVPVTLDVEDDMGDAYALVSGSVGGYALTGFRRNSPTSYAATFTVVEGGESYSASEKIPVADLMISNESGQSPPYMEEISQSNDPIDATRPQVLSMNVDEGMHKIGDVVILYIEADGTGYAVDSRTTINGISIDAERVSFTESGDGRYALSYVVEEGDPEVDPLGRKLPATVVLLEPSGNEGTAYSMIGNVSQVSIDTRAPVVIRLEVPSIAVGPGGIVQVYMMADGSGYRAGAGTTINGIPLSSEQITFSEGSHGAYTLSYAVGPEDAEVAEGDLEVTVVPVDPAGNRGTPYSILEPNYLEIYTSLPEATLAGPPRICQGEDVVLNVMLEGRRPLSFVLNDGMQVQEFSGVTSDVFQVAVSPEETTTYRIERVTDVNGVENVGSGEVRVQVNAGTEVEILPLASGYSVEADPVPLQASVEGGIFSGPGVISSTSTFYPDLAGISDTPHTITYTFENNTGCVTSDSVSVYVLGSEATLLMPVSALCSGEGPVEVAAMNLAGVTGSFTLLDDGGQPVPGLEDHQDNTATIDPSVLDPGDYEVEFRYEDGVPLVLTTSFTYEIAEAPRILDLGDVMCQSLMPVPLRSDMESVLFEGSGVTGDEQNGYHFDPGQASAGYNTLYATYVTENGCRLVTEKEVEILPVPQLLFGISSACIPEGGEMVNFLNLTSAINEVASWSWDFGDPSSGEDNTSNLVNPSHFYGEPGQREISLTAVTNDGCETSTSMESLIDSKPVADFTWVSDCLPPGSAMQFINRSDYGSASADTILWRFYDGTGALMDETGMPPGADTLTYFFSGPGTYRVELYTTGSGGCNNELSKQVNLRSTIRPEKEGYVETFDASQGGWTVHSEGQQESWVWGTPDFEGYEPEPGNQAWFTRLPVSGEDYTENSWVMSPCFDLSGMERPVIRMNIMKSFVPYLNGAVLQYRQGPEAEWQTLGESSPGIEWYNSSEITLKPGGSQVGWGMETFDPDREWVNAMHDLDRVAGLSNVLFRIAIATGGQESFGNQGFAFDDVRIAERTKFTVLEHFTDYNDDDSRMADQIIATAGKDLRKDVIDLHYHMSVNPVPSATRALNYGVTQVPFTVLDGGVVESMRFTLDDLQQSDPEDLIRLATLGEPAFDIDLEVDWGEDGMEVRTSLTCLKDRYDKFVQLYLVVFETRVTSYTTSNGNNAFRNVVLDMLPSPSGSLFEERWQKGKNVLQTDSWTYPPYVEDRGELAVAAFAQERNSNQILQAAVQYRDPTVGLPARSPLSWPLKVYPNPAGALVQVSLGEGIQDRSNIFMMDMQGKTLLEMEIPAGMRTIPLQLDAIPRGVYLIRWTGGGTLLGVAKLVKTQQ
jgi:PKD repeat protein